MPTAARIDEITNSLGTPLQILLVEDNPADSEVILLLLEQSNFPCRIQRVSDGVEALEFLQDRPALPDVVLLDLGLPRKDGREVLREIRKDERTRKLPVIVLTTSDRTEDMLHSFQHRADSFLTKPTDLYGYEALIKRLTTLELARLRGDLR